MPIKSTILTIFLLISTIVFSQQDYPKTSIINGDTLTTFYYWQSKEILKELIQKDKQEIEIDLYRQKINNLKQKVSYLEEIVLEKEENEQLFLDNITYYEARIYLKDLQIKEYEKQNRKRKVRNGFILGGVVSVSTSLIIITAIK